MGQFKAASSSNSIARTGVAVDLRLFRKSLGAVERSHRLTKRVESYLTDLRLLSVSYEELLEDHASTVSRVRRHLSLDAQESQKPETALSLHKATPNRLCKAVENYEQLCVSYQHTEYESFFELPCNLRC
mmetsp:Transcript_1681/g.3967  ORF Transcript_1681/g.3967 Transcript_1681/m.3967 type:complete len:130 (-) Transcript_1681:18-407(-)